MAKVTDITGVLKASAENEFYDAISMPLQNAIALATLMAHHPNEDDEGHLPRAGVPAPRAAQRGEREAR